VCCLGHLIHRAIEDEFVGAGGLCEAAKFSDELQRRRVDFFVCRRRFEVVQGLNVSTHSSFRLVLRQVNHQSHNNHYQPEGVSRQMRFVSTLRTDFHSDVSLANLLVCKSDSDDVARFTQAPKIIRPDFEFAVIELSGRLAHPCLYVHRGHAFLRAAHKTLPPPKSQKSRLHCNAQRVLVASSSPPVVSVLGIAPTPAAVGDKRQKKCYYHRKQRRRDTITSKG
jgi:hypothetical protein